MNQSSCLKKFHLKNLIVFSISLCLTILIFSSNASAKLQTSRFKNVVFKSNWTYYAPAKYGDTPYFLDLRGYGKKNCCGENKIEHGIWFEYECRLNISDAVNAWVWPYLGVNCDCSSINRSRRYSLRLLVKKRVYRWRDEDRWVDSDRWVDYFDKTVTWMGERESDSRHIWFPGLKDDARYQVQIFTKVEGRGTLYGLIEFTDF